MQTRIHVPGLALCICWPFSFPLLEQTPLSHALLCSPLPFPATHDPCAHSSLTLLVSPQGTRLTAS